MNGETVSVLLVEDSPGDARLVKEYLSDAKGEFNAELTVKETLADALDLLELKPFDVILLDMSLPDSNGIDTFTSCHSAAPRTPILLLTGLSDDMIARQIIALGAQDYLVKGSLDGATMARAIKYAIERNELQKELHAHAEVIRSILEGITDAILIVDKDGTILFANPAVENLLGVEKDDIVCELWSRINAGVASMETNIKTRDHGALDLEMNISDFEWESKEAHLIVLRNVTERKKVEAERARFVQLEALGILAGGIAHDFNNVLTGIMGNVTIAQLSVEPGSKLQETLLRTERSCRAAGDLVQKLMPFARGGKPVKGRVSMPMFLTDSLQNLDVPSSITVDISLQEELWEADLDVQQVKTALLAVVTNSIQAITGTGTVSIHGKNAWIKEGDLVDLPTGPYIRVIVSDTGEGIDDKNLNRVFDPYFTTRNGSDGLGLTVAFSVVKRHKGQILIHPGEDGGTTVELLIPAIGKGDILRNDKNGSYHLPDGVDERSPGGAVSKSVSILVMDDERDILDVAERMISIMGHFVCTVQNGMEAIDLYQKTFREGRPFDAVILDINVPDGMGGKDTLGKLREIDPEVRAIVSSGFFDDPIMTDYSRYGFMAAIAKPYNSSDLERVLSQVVA